MIRRKNKMAVSKEFIHKETCRNTQNVFTPIIPIVLALITIPALAQNKIDSTAIKDEMRKQRIELSKTGKNHKLLANFIGRWTFTGKHLSPDTTLKPRLEFNGFQEVKATLDERFFIFERTGEKLVMPWSNGQEITLKEMYIEGYDNIKKKFVTASIGNHWETGIYTTEGTYDSTTQTFTYDGEFASAAASGKMRKIHDLIKIIDKDHYKAERYNIIDGRVMGITRMNFTRVKGSK
jgi:hypothetical protein